MSDNIGDKPFVVDLIILTCNGCQAERRFKIDPPIRSAKEALDWMNTKPGPCTCGATTCNARLRLADQN